MHVSMHTQLFELVQATLTLQKRSVQFFCLYHPPPSKKNKLSDCMFLEQFPKTTGILQLNMW